MSLTGAEVPEISHTVLSFEDLNGWHKDAHDHAFDAFKSTCAARREADWQAVCSAAVHITDAKVFFELFFRPVLIEDGQEMLFTGYFEPELTGSRVRSERFRYPLYRMPKEATNKPWLTRRQILESGILNGRGLEIAWVDDPVELFFLQIQGSGRVRLAEGGTIRVGYGGNNGHGYRSVGQELIRRGVLKSHQASAASIQSWVRRNPAAGRELLFLNPSYVFFREVSHVPADLGPLGAMNRSLTAGRSLAIDPALVPLGAPVWIEKAGETPIKRLMIAQDTGSAIKGPQRGDVFFGTGDVAGMIAGRTRDPGRMIVLMPIQRAYAMVPDVRP